MSIYLDISVLYYKHYIINSVPLLTIKFYAIDTYLNAFLKSSIVATLIGLEITNWFGDY